MIKGSEMSVVDANAEALGVPRKQLMESSGNALADAIREVASATDCILIVAGRGNNGGDAFVTARFLDEFDVQVRLLGRAETITTDIARENWDTLVTAEYDTAEIRDSTALDLSDADVLVDAMLGTGISGNLREPVKTAATAMNEADAPVLSVDVPSGLDSETGDMADTAVTPDHVVTFHDTKPGLAELDADIRVADIGIPEAAELFVERGDLQRLSRRRDSHKGDHGEVLIIGGGPYTGAPALTAQAALRTGADLVKVTCPTSVAHEIQGYSENLILYPMQGRRLQPGHVGPVMEYAREHDVLVIGPGLGDDDETLDAARAIIESYDGTAVVDADPLQIVPEIETEANLICTPHQGELVKMGGRSSADWQERCDLVADFAADIGHTVLLKGAYDIVTDNDQHRVSRTGNAGMTVGGTGDILAGVTGALAAVQDPFEAAVLGAYITGRAGDIVADEHGNGLVASDLLDAIPKAMEQPKTK
ncbi:NAD(P)H-hydrate dehydratase [Halovenus rubra]|uniref:Bifunctional NAD(P)H-hydrate repair enzyme n=2 Tax=Halovenus rubra TaxID=869890 RepID=A0ABD5X0S7_9EURY|nr:NAD(P)H-hydrate dehydratase [Halovenus rubra]